MSRQRGAQQERVEIGGGAVGERALGRVRAVRRGHVAHAVLEAVDGRARVHAALAHERLRVACEHDRARRVDLADGVSERVGPLLERLFGSEAGEEGLVAELPRPHRGLAAEPVHHALHERDLALDEVVVGTRVALLRPGQVVQLGQTVVGKERHDRLEVVAAGGGEQVAEAVLGVGVVLPHLRLEQLPRHEQPHERDASRGDGGELRVEVAVVPGVERRALFVERVVVHADREQLVAQRPQVFGVAGSLRFGRRAGGLTVLGSGGLGRLLALGGAHWSSPAPAYSS